MYCHYMYNNTCRLAHWKVSFIQRYPIFRVSFIRGSIVNMYIHSNENVLVSSGQSLPAVY